MDNQLESQIDKPAYSNSILKIIGIINIFLFILIWLSQGEVYIPALIAVPAQMFLFPMCQTNGVFVIDVSLWIALAISALVSGAYLAYSQFTKKREPKQKIFLVFLLIYILVWLILDLIEFSCL